MQVAFLHVLNPGTGEHRRGEPYGQGYQKSTGGKGRGIHDHGDGDSSHGRDGPNALDERLHPVVDPGTPAHGDTRQYAGGHANEGPEIGRAHV